MNPGLLFLLRLHLRGDLRRISRRFSARRGKFLLLLFTLVVAGILYGQHFLPPIGLAENSAAVGLAPDQLRHFAAPMLLLIALLGTRAHGFYFKPAEVQFLFPAPISRRQLLLYNILSRMQTSVLSASCALPFVFSYAATAYGAFISCLLALTFIQLTGQFFGLLLAMIVARGWAGITTAVATASAVLVLGSALLVASTEISAGFAAAFSAALESPLVSTISWLARPFIEIFIASGIYEVVGWSCVAGGILLAEVLAMMRMDTAYLESLINRPSVRERSRLRAATGRAVAGGRGYPGISIRLFPQWRGVGPLVWRQCQEVIRQPATLLRGGFGLLVVIPIILIRFTSTGLQGGSLAINLLISCLVAIPMLVDGADFRRDLDRMGVLRALPLAPVVVSLGQIVPTALLTIFWTAVATALITAVSPGLPAALVVFVCWLIPPYALLSSAIDNFLYLLLPYRLRTRDPGETTFLGRLVMMMSMRVFALLLSIGVCGAVTTFILVLVSPGLAYAGPIASAILGLCCVPVVFAVAWAFNRFDVAQQISE